MNIGTLLTNRLRHFRKSLNYNTRDLAELMGTSQSRVSSVETGKSKLDDRYLDLFCHALRIPTEMFLTHDLYSSDIFQIALDDYNKRIKNAECLYFMSRFLIPLPLQIRDYTRASFHQFAYFMLEKNFGEIDFLRKKSDAQKYCSTRNVRIILLENSLYNEVGSPRLMKAQLKQILDSSISVKIVPHQTSSFCGGSLTIFDNQSISDDNVSSYTFNNNPEICTWAHRLFEANWALADTLGSTSEILHKALEYYDKKNN